MKGKTRYIAGLFLILLFISCFLAGCISGKQNGNSNRGSSTNTTVTGLEKEYDASFTGVLCGIDRKKEICRFYDPTDGKTYELEYSGGTRIRSRYDKEQTSAYLEPGRIFDVYYVASDLKAVKFAENKDAFEMNQVENLEFVNAQNMIRIGSKKFIFDEQLMIFSGDEQITQIELSNQDELTVRGMDKNVYSVSVSTGHGYLSFVNYEDFLGGYVSIGNTQIANVTEDMLLTAKAGTYTISMENGELYGSKRVTVAQNERVVVDMGEFSIAPERIGRLKFSIYPADASLYINDRYTGYQNEIRLNYGAHKVTVQAPGYKTFHGVLNVNGSQTQQIEIILAQADSDDKTNTGVDDGNDDDSDNSELVDVPDEEDSDGDNGKEDPDEDAGDDGNDGNGDSQKPDEEERTDSEHKLKVTSPAGANVYLDGELLGTAPVSVEKITGKHVITLYQSGRVTKSYEVEIENDNEDVSLSFPELPIDG